MIIYNLFFESVLVKAKQIKFIDNLQLPRKRKATTNYSMLHYLDGVSPYENLENLLIKAIAGKDFTSEKKLCTGDL